LERFETTRWGIILRAREPHSPDAQSAYTHLCKQYWRPLYSFVRRKGFGPEESRDLVQDLMTRFWEKKSLRNVRPEKGHFRTLLLASMNNLLKDERARRTAKKRNANGLLASIDVSTAEEYFQQVPNSTTSPESQFDREWVMAILRDAYEAIRKDFARLGKANVFDLYAPYLTHEHNATPYAALSKRTGMSQTAIRSGVSRLRTRYQAEIRKKVADTVSSMEHVEDEYAYLVSLFDESVVHVARGPIQGVERN
jgi:RNA polymerase sigma-70 factor (ECF subfamily)